MKRPARPILVTGGAGFVGSHVALAFARAGRPVIAFDNLRRRGSELALDRLRAGGVTFIHGDIRIATDLAAVGPFALLVDCAAEPSAHAGSGDDAGYITEVNLGGTLRCLEAARRQGADVIFMSTSRVYPVEAMRALPLQTLPTRFALAPDASGPGWSAQGIAEDFPLAGRRTLYGATKLASETMVTEYGGFGLRTIVLRCGVIAGPWQMGKVDQGFVALWVARHLLGGSLSYIGYGGKGQQLRDILHVDDLTDLLVTIVGDLNRFAGKTFNVGGGADFALSPRELTTLCAALTGRRMRLARDPTTRIADIPYYVSDNRNIASLSGWRPKRDGETIVKDVVKWIKNHESLLRPVFHSR